MANDAIATSRSVDILLFVGGGEESPFFVSTFFKVKIMAR